MCNNCDTGCETCAPTLTVTVEDSEGYRDDEGNEEPGCIVSVRGPSADAVSRFVEHNRSIGGSSWERDGDFAYAMPMVHVGCVEAWRSEGYALDLSGFSIPE